MSILDLSCKEIFSPEYRVRSATPEEVLKLKSLTYLDDTVESTSKYAMVSGGFAAWVNGRTTTYDDIDIFCTRLPAGLPRRIPYEEDYQHFTVQSCGIYQFVTWMYDNKLHKNADDFFTEILDSFDLDICRVGYFRRHPSKKYYCIERTAKARARNLWRQRPDRFRKYSKRVKSPFKLFELALNTCLETDMIGTVRLTKNLCFPIVDK